MKKKIITVALVLSSVCVMAQQKENRDTDRNILRGPYETNGFWSNWYIGVQSPNQKIPDRKTKCVIKTHINIKQNVIFGAKLKPV